MIIYMRVYGRYILKHRQDIFISKKQHKLTHLLVNVINSPNSDKINKIMFSERTAWSAQF